MRERQSRPLAAFGGWFLGLAFAGLGTLYGLLASPGLGLASELKVVPAPERFPYMVNPTAPLAELLPPPPKTFSASRVWNEDLAQVPEILFQEPLPHSLAAKEAKEKTAEQLA